LGGSAPETARDHLRSGPAAEKREDSVDRIRVLNEALWKEVPRDVILEAEQAAKASPVWIARQGNGHIVAMDGPGDPDVATGDVMFIAEVAPERES
jgi:hypothetical protein